jgi:hypothetical protein
VNVNQEKMMIAIDWIVKRAQGPYAVTIEMWPEGAK